MISLFELTVGNQYRVEGNVQPLIDYLRGELKDDTAKDFIAKVLLGEIKLPDKRCTRKEAQRLADAFYVRRLTADFSEREHKEPHVTNDEIYAGLDSASGYEFGTAERMIKRYRKGDTKRR